MDYEYNDVYILRFANTRRNTPIMKRVLSLVLCAVMILAAFASCSTLDNDDDKGAIIDVYLTNEIYDFDPARGFTDASTAKFLSLIFEGLTKLNEDGDWENALMDSYEISQDDDEAFKIQITLKETKWSDSRRVQANDIVYAWKRILNPEFKCEASSMLFDIKNAYEVKKGDVSVDDLGVAAIETYVLEIEFVKKIDLDAFFRTVASPALVPLREDIVETNDNWAKKASSLITNGPFDVKEISTGSTVRLERSSYYYRDTEDEEALDSYVIPYRIITHYDKGILADQLDAFLSGDIFYIGELPLTSRNEYKEYANAADYPATHTYYFNENNEILADPNVRKALSMAIDRQAIADLVVFASPATGIVPPVTSDAETGTSFREKGGELISASADLNKAKSLLSKAGVSGGELTISIRNDEVDEAVADYVKGVWEKLGFKIKIKKLTYSYDADDSTIMIDEYYNAYINGDYDVIAVDMQMLSSDAYSALAPFAKDYSGYGVNMNPEKEKDADGNEVYLYEERTHSTGYENEKYNDLFKKYYETEDTAERTKILHDAEKMLIDDCAVMPLYFMQDHFMFSDILDGMSSTYFGRNFNDLEMDGYLEHNEELMEAVAQDE